LKHFLFAMFCSYDYPRKIGIYLSSENDNFFTQYVNYNYPNI